MSVAGRAVAMSGLEARLDERAQTSACALRVAAEEPESVVNVDGRGSCGGADDVAVRAPSPLLWSSHEPGANWVERYVPNRVKEVGFALDQARVVTPLHEVAELAMPAVEALRIDTQ